MTSPKPVIAIAGPDLLEFEQLPDIGAVAQVAAELEQAQRLLTDWQVQIALCRLHAAWPQELERTRILEVSGGWELCASSTLWATPRAEGNHRLFTAFEAEVGFACPPKDHEGAKDALSGLILFRSIERHDIAAAWRQHVGPRRVSENIARGLEAGLPAAPGPGPARPRC